MEDVYIVSGCRTAIGSFQGSLSSVSSIQLGSTAIQGAVARSGIAVDRVDEVFMGNVLSAGLGQAPARQAARQAALLDSVPCTTVHKVCASGLKAVMLGAQSLAIGQAAVVVAGGMESMSNVPYYLPRARKGHQYGHAACIDGLLHDGLWDVDNDFAMGCCAEDIVNKMSLTRKAQDDYAIASYKRAQTAGEKGYFKKEIVGVQVPQRKGDPVVVEEDEEYHRVKFDKIAQLRPVFDPKGSVTAANSSTLNDGAAALVLASETAVKTHQLQPIARILGYADAAQAPIAFTTTPALAIPKALHRARIAQQDIDFFEINEAFACVALANQQLLSLDTERLNVFGGAVALGHPIGCSGARILVTLLNVLQTHRAKRGVAAICNGGGGASALVVERT